jgi:putative ABC transport system ATP-binding protein
VTGASGSGKSTLLNLLGGLDTPSSGTIEIEGRRISEMSREELAVYRRSGVGMIFQSFNLIPGFSALENVALPLVFAGVAKKERRERAREELARVGLEARAAHRPSELSGGEQQRVAIARALVNRPRLILADEPTGNLDSRTSREIVSLLAELNRRQGLTVIMVTHEESLAREFAGRGVRLHDGRVESEEMWR